MTLLPQFVGISGFAGSNTDPVTPIPVSLAIPDGTQVGDLLVASIVTQSTLVAPGRGLSELYTAIDFDFHSWGIGVWAGLWDGDPTPIEWQGSGWASATGQFFGALLASFRDRIDSGRSISVSNGPTVTGLSGEGPAVCVNWVRASIGGVSGFAPFEGTDWTQVGAVDAAYALGTVAINGGTVAAETATDTDDAGGTANTGRYMVFGVDGQTVAPPCRLYPRDDQLGGSGRIWPPPKSHQYSPRRAGGYY